ncbi:uncharacterized protein J4E84_003583 [Alternaria hordeiaustralica]|uniref:uncharacterized protein n=1 Tax=Alternaria hordeiaustralica TaxID=1187925 RepID=UPI0020C3E78B|nr:uncharacterized protein J4E84_003583 [Alternaria hordeiaustralica]KAI4691292.1 hypothetical protein J4E84_003583 [Alternaria hordeiaustralica]
MSDANSDDWVDSSESSDDDEDGEASDGDDETSTSEQQFPRRSVDEVESAAANTRRRTSSISSGLAAMTPAEVTSTQPRQPTPPPPRRSSTLPDQIEHDPSHDRARSPKSSLPDYHDPDSPTQKRGHGIPRNPVADTWREDAYLKKEPSERKISSAEAGKMQDRWRCEYCGRLNERGGETTTTMPDPEDPRVGTAGPSTAPTGPVRIPAYEPSGVSETRCAYCGEKLTLDLSKYDPREFSEFGVNFNLMYFKDKADYVEQARKAWQRARHRVGIRWSEDDRRHRSESRKAKEKRREEEEVQSPLGWTVRPGSEERVEPREDEGEDNDAEENDDEWEDDNEPGGPQE